MHRSLDHVIGVRIPASQPHKPFNHINLRRAIIDLANGLQTTLSATGQARTNITFNNYELHPRN